MSCHKCIQRDLNPNFKGLLSRGTEGAHLKCYKRCTGENDPYLCYCNNFLTVSPFFVFSNSLSSNVTLLKKPLCFITFLIKVSLYYTITKRIKFKLLTLAFKVLQYPVNTHVSQTEYSFFFPFLSDIAFAWKMHP